MKAKNHLQIEVDALSRRLPKLRIAHKKWASLNLFSHYVHRTKSQYTCFDCGHSWNVSAPPAMGYLIDETCPKCKLTLKSTERKIRIKREDNRMAIYDVVGRFQVVRFFFVTKHIRLGEKPDVIIQEIVQHWITPEGKTIVRSVTFNGLGQYGYTEGWCLTSALEIRTYGRVNDNLSQKYFVNSTNKNTKYEYPNAKYIPELKRNGFKGNTHGFNTAYFFALLLSSPMAETLLKAKQHRLLGSFSDNRDSIAKYWSSIKICIRHGYIIKNAHTWLDYLGQLEQFKKDIHNPKYICAPTLEADHRHLTKKITAIREREDAERRKAMRIEREREYKQAKARFFELKLSNGIINVVVLKSIDEFEAEGKELNHCVYASDYYDKKQSLIMSARLEDKRLETLEISLDKFEIRQCYGLNHKETVYHEAILKLVKENMTKIKKIAKQKV